MILCAVALPAVLVFWLWKGRVWSGEKKKILVILALSALLGLMLGIYEKQNPVLLEGNLLKRNENGMGDYEEELELTVEGLLEEYRYQVEIPEQALAKEEAEALLASAVQEIEEEFPGDNESVNCIRERVVIRDTYQDGKVQAEWSFDDYSVVDFEGNVIAEEPPEEGMLVRAEVELQCAEFIRLEEFYFQVFPRLLDEKENFLLQLYEKLAEQGKESGNAYMELPDQVGNYEIEWSMEQEHLPEKVLLLGCLLACMMPFLEQSRAQERLKKRNRQLVMEYPDMVSKLALLLGSGMTLQGAWRKIAFSYSEKRKYNAISAMPAYEEMLITCREMESGVGEERAYARFGERCGQAGYRRFANILTQNLRKGNRGITALLETEAEHSFEERKNMAKKYGEEAGTKLLLPMMLMLGIIMLILIVPAVFTFQM